MNCPNPKCKGRIKKVKNSDGSYYYHCPSCGYTKEVTKKR